MTPAAYAPALSTETLFSIRAETWRRLLLARGAPRGLRSPLPHGAALLAALDATGLVRDLLPAPLAEACDRVEPLACEPARQAFYEAGRALALKRDWRAYVSPADLAADVLADEATDLRAAELLACVAMRVARRFPPRTWYQFLAADALEPGEPTQYIERIGAGVRAVLEAGDRGPWLRVRAFGDARKAHFEIAHEDRAAACVVVDPEVLAHGVHRPVRSHLASFDTKAGRLFFWSAVPELVLPMVEAIATALTGDPDGFFRRRAVNLRAVQDAAGKGKLPRHGAHFASVAFIGGTWDSGRGHTVSTRGTDAFDGFRAHAIDLDGGSLRLATLRAQVVSSASGAATADLAVRPPYTATCSEPSLAAPFLRWADAADVTNPAPRRRDVLAFEPYEHALATWRELPEHERLARLEILVEGDATRSVRHPRHPHADDGFTAFALGDGRHYCVGEDPLFDAFVVGDGDLVKWRFDWAALGRRVAKKLALKGGRFVVDADGVVLLGARDLGATRASFYLVTRACAASVGDRLRMESMPGHAVVVAPPGRTALPGLAHAAMDRLAGPYRPVLADAVRKLGLVDSVAPTLYAPKRARIVIHLKPRVVYVDRVAIVRAGEPVFRMLHFLAENLGRLVGSGELGAAISSTSTDDALARKTKERFEKAVRESFEALGKEPPEDLATLIDQARKGEYRLGVPVFVA